MHNIYYYTKIQLIERMGDDRWSGTPNRAGFARTLKALKRDGSNILFVGADTAGTHGLLCNRLLGKMGRTRRYLLVVTDDRDRIPLDEHETGGTDRVLDYSELECSDGSERTDGGEQPPLGALGTEIIDTVDAFDDLAEGLEPSELRVCVDSLVPLLREHPPEKVFRLLHVMTSRVGQVRGIGHYHLPLERGHDAVALLEPLFDATVEIRTRGGSYEQRWQFRNREIATEWVPF